MFVLLWLSGDFLPLLLLLNAVISTVTVFFAPAEASMIPQLVPKQQLVAANGVFTLTLNAAFAVGYALMGSIVVTLAGAPGLILVVAVCYLIAAGFCWTLPAVAAGRRDATAGQATAGHCSGPGDRARDGLDVRPAAPRASRSSATHRSISW